MKKLFLSLTVLAVNFTSAQSGLGQAFTSANSDLTGASASLTTLLTTIAGFSALAGLVGVTWSYLNGDQNVTKQIAMWMGGIALFFGGLAIVSTAFGLS